MGFKSYHRIRFVIKSSETLAVLILAKIIVCRTFRCSHCKEILSIRMLGTVSHTVSVELQSRRRNIVEIGRDSTTDNFFNVSVNCYFSEHARKVQFGDEATKTLSILSSDGPTYK